MSDLDEFDHDTFDNADAYALLDTTEAREMGVCVLCDSYECRHRCGFCGLARPCPCDAGGEMSQREFRAAEARYDGSPARRRRA